MSDKNEKEVPPKEKKRGSETWKENQDGAKRPSGT